MKYHEKFLISETFAVHSLRITAPNAYNLRKSRTFEIFFIFIKVTQVQGKFLNIFSSKFHVRSTNAETKSKC